MAKSGTANCANAITNPEAMLTMVGLNFLRSPAKPPPNLPIVLAMPRPKEMSQVKTLITMWVYSKYGTTEPGLIYNVTGLKTRLFSERALRSVKSAIK